MKYSTLVLGSFLGLAILAAAASAVALADDGKTGMALRLGQAVRAAQAQPDRSVLTVNGIPISERAIALMRATLEANGTAPGDVAATARRLVIRQALLKHEAEVRGFVVTDAEVDAWIARQRATPPAPEAAAADAALLRGLGQTNEQYWRTPGLRDSIRSGLAINKLQTALGPTKFEQLAASLVAAAEVK